MNSTGSIRKYIVLKGLICRDTIKTTILKVLDVKILERSDFVCFHCVFSCFPACVAERAQDPGLSGVNVED